MTADRASLERMLKRQVDANAMLRNPALWARNFAAVALPAILAWADEHRDKLTAVYVELHVSRTQLLVAGTKTPPYDMDLGVAMTALECSFDRHALGYVDSVQLPLGAITQAHPDAMLIWSCYPRRP